MLTDCLFAVLAAYADRLHVLLCLQPVLPSICSPADAHAVVQGVVRRKPRAVLYGDTAVVSGAEFLERCRQPFNALLRAKAEKVCSLSQGRKGMLSKPRQRRYAL